MMVVPSAKAAATASTRYSSIIDGARSAGTSTPRSFEARTRSCAIGSPASPRVSLSSIDAPISRSVVNRPVRSGFVITSVSTMSEPATISAATIGNAADDGSAGTMTPAPCSSGWPVSDDPAAVAAFVGHGDDLGAKMLQHQLGVVAAGLALDDRGDAGRGQSRQQHRRFDLRRGHRRAVDDRQRIARALQRQRQAAAVASASHPRAHQFQRIEHPPHRPAAQRGIAVEGRRDRAAGDRAHHQAASGAGIAEIERRLRLPRTRLTPTPRTDQAISPLSSAPFDLRAQRLHRPGGIEHVLALEQARDSGFTNRQRAQESGPGGKSTCRRAPGRARSSDWLFAPQAASAGRNESRLRFLLCAAGITGRRSRHACELVCKALLTGPPQLAK